MSWRAYFLDGPAAGPEHDRRFAATRVHRRLWLAQVPDEDGRIAPEAWSVVGSLPGAGPPAEPWPGQVEYALDPDLSDLEAEGHGGDGFAVFRLVD
ncbi:MAG TPA: hypothetical protein VFR49_05785 [Solirubrobacteraceae bacterium]|nr:hypothetical protein [Solirubrobacteraceae bacterium]